MKKRVIGLLALVMALLTATAGIGVADAADTKYAFGEDPNVEGHILYWWWDQVAFDESVKRFNEYYPNVTFEYLAVSDTDYMKKLQTAYASGDKLPDLINADSTYRGKLYNMGILADLSAEPINYDVSNLYEYTLPLSYNDSGELVGVQQTLAPGCIAYRADVAEKWLGTSDPAELEVMFPDWDSLIAKGEEVLAASNGSVHMLSGLDEAYNIISNQNTHPFVADGKLNLENSIGPAIKYLAEMRDRGTVDKLSMWSPSWSNAFVDGSVIFFAGTTWFLHFGIEINDPEGAEQGLWRYMKTPGGGWNNGGGSLCVLKDSPSLEAAWAYIKFATSPESCVERKQIYWLMNNTKAYMNPEYPELESFPVDILGGQDMIKFFIGEVIPDSVARKVSEYDAVVSDAVKFSYQQLDSDPALGYDGTMQMIQSEILSQMPELG